MFGDRGERRQDGHRLEFDHLAHAAARLGRPRQADGGRVGQEEKVELATLGGLGDLDRVGKTRARVEMRFRMTPGSDVLTGLMDESAEMHHPASGLLRHALLSRSER